MTVPRQRGLQALRLPSGRRSRSRALWALLVILAASAGVACAEDPLPPAAELDGRYVLATVDGDTLPTLISSAIFANTFLVSGHITFLSRGRLVDVRSQQEFDTRYARWGPLTTDSLVASYSVSGEQVLIHRPTPLPTDGYSDTASLSGDRLTVRMRLGNALQPSVRRLLYIKE
jgi:hypothetical protein